jgi:hypothetical protein
MKPETKGKKKAEILKPEISQKRTRTKKRILERRRKFVVMRQRSPEDFTILLRSCAWD